MLEIYKCKKDVEEVISKTDFQSEIENMVGEINSFGGQMADTKICIGEIPMHLEEKGKRLKAQIHVTVTIHEFDFFQMNEEQEH